MILNLDLLDKFLRHLDAFGLNLRFRISAEELSQLFWRIHQKFRVLIFANNWVDSISFGIMILNLDLLDEFHGIYIHLALILKFRISAEGLIQDYSPKI